MPQAPHVGTRQQYFAAAGLRTAHVHRPGTGVGGSTALPKLVCARAQTSPSNNYDAIRSGKSIEVGALRVAFKSFYITPYHHVSSLYSVETMASMISAALSLDQSFQPSL